MGAQRPGDQPVVRLDALPQLAEARACVPAWELTAPPGARLAVPPGVLLLPVGELAFVLAWELTVGPPAAA